MAYDPTKWESHLAAYKYWFACKHEYEKNVQIRRLELITIHGTDNIDLLRIISNDYKYRVAISDETWARQQTEFYAQVLLVDKLSKLLFILEKDE